MIKSNDQTATRLLEAALDCFSASGFHGTTTRAICGRAGVNLALLNYHFGSKVGLWNAVVRILNDRIAALAVGVAFTPGASVHQVVSEVVRAVVRGMLADPRPMRLMVWAALAPDGFDRQVLFDASSLVLAQATAWLEAAQRKGLVSEEVDVPLSLVTFYGLLAEPLVEPKLHHHLFGRDPTDPEHAARIERHLVRSALTLLGCLEAR